MVTARYRSIVLVRTFSMYGKNMSQKEVEDLTFEVSLYFCIKALEHEYIFSKYSRNLHILGIFWAWYTNNSFPIIFPKYKKPHFLRSIEILTCSLPKGFQKQDLICI